MSNYNPPVKDMLFIFDELCDLKGLNNLPNFTEISRDMVDHILNESAKFTSEVLAPLNQSGDQETSVLKDGEVTTPKGFKEAYKNFIEGGWNSTPFAPEHGGMGLPWMLTTSLQEMWQSANLAWSLCPLLTIGAIEAVIAHATPQLRNTFLPKLVSGEWTGTMNLTEPQAGTDMSLLKSRAIRDGENYRITGQKIYITYGEQDFTENIVHLVLARLPNSPTGVKGISLFLVPKFLVNEDGSLGERNDVFAVNIEHKLGIHASPTCVMSYGDNEGAIGYLVGKENDGLSCMFTMMNNARLNVGLQGVAIGERAYQQAVEFAKSRIQSAAVSGNTKSTTIIKHPDVRRMLMMMRSQIEAMRAIAYYTNSALDISRNHTEKKVRDINNARMDLLTPVVKAWCTDLGVEIASMGLQVHGGMGFIEETGAAQYFRDSRIAPIYEGTNGIQAIDLLGRKFLRDGGSAMDNLINEIGGIDEKLIETDDADCKAIQKSLREGLNSLRTASEWLLDPKNNDIDTKFSGATPFLHLTGTVVGGWLMARSALAAHRKLPNSKDRPFLEAKIITARFYADHILPRANAFLPEITRGSGSVMALPEESF